MIAYIEKMIQSLIEVVMKAVIHQTLMDTVHKFLFFTYSLDISNTRLLINNEERQISIWHHNDWKIFLENIHLTILYGQNVYKVEIKNTVGNRLDDPVLLFATNNNI